jgi:hypothetical protein
LNPAANAAEDCGELSGIDSPSEFTIGSAKIDGLSLTRQELKELNAVAESGNNLSQLDPKRVQDFAEQILRNKDTQRDDAKISTHYIDTKLVICKQHSGNTVKIVDVHIRPSAIAIGISKSPDIRLTRLVLRTPAGVLKTPNSLVSFLGDNDRSYGPSLAFDTGLQSLAAPADISSLSYSLRAQKSLTKEFGEYSGGFSFSNYQGRYQAVNKNATHPAYSIGLNYSYDDIPLGSNTLQRNSASINYYLTNHLGNANLTYVLGGSTSLGNSTLGSSIGGDNYNNEFRTSSYAQFTLDLGSSDLSIDAQGLYGNNSGDSEFWKFIASAALQGEHRLSTNTIDTKNLGKGKDCVNNLDKTDPRKGLFLCDRTQSYGLSLIAAYGTSSGSLPESEQYFVGYRSVGPGRVDQPANLSPILLISNPILRSAGTNQFGLDFNGGSSSGGNNFWSFSSSLSIPIKSWSRPLVGDQLNVGKLSTRGTIWGIIIASYPDMLDKLVASTSMTREKADEYLRPIFNLQIKPTIAKLLYQQNLYSIKPFFAFDVAGIGLGSTNSTWTGIGGGLEGNLTGLTLQIGYMQTLSPRQDSDIGNLFFRFALNSLDFF